MTSPLSGRRAQAARNDERILDAAREVFVADPKAPIAAVAERAGVGISALYRRYGSKEDLLHRLCSDGLNLYIDAARAAMSEDGDPWAAFAGFLRTVVHADTHSLTVSLAGQFTPDERLHSDAVQAGELVSDIVDRAHAAGVLRRDVVAADLGVLFEQLASVHGGDDDRTRELRDRYLDLLLDALRIPAEHRRLSGPPPVPREFAVRWNPAVGTLS